MIQRLLLAACLLLPQLPARAEPHALGPADIAQLREIGDAQISPDGAWVAYTLRRQDLDKDQQLTDLWISRSDGSRSLQLTQGGDVEGKPRWSPDARRIAFLAKRGADEAARKHAQLWQIALEGGEAQPLTSLKTGVADFQWAPDGQRLLLVLDDADPADEPELLEGWKRKTRPPIVIDRFHFKQDREGYLGPQRQHLYLFEPAGAKLTPLTRGEFGESKPAWSPDGRQIAFLSPRMAERERSEATGLYVMEARADAPARELLANFSTDEDAYPAWSPDGRQLAVLMGDEGRWSAYQRWRLATVAAAGGAPRILTQALDRGLQARFAWAPDGASLYASVDDDGAAWLARIGLDGRVEKLSDGRRSVSGLSLAAKGQIALLASTAKQPPELQLLQPAAPARLLPLTRHNAWAAEVRWGRSDDFASRSADGTEVHGLISYPPEHQPGQRYPTLLLIHGGPNGQDGHSLAGRDLLREELCAAGYVVLQVNYRGSSGRGDAYQRAIYADWVNKEVLDLQGAVDWAVGQGIADPARLGVGGWSYGGILTNALIAADTRFKAAVAGAGSANQLAMFGTDQYAVQYERELGAPWRNPALWLKVSAPFFNAERIKTPTLFMGGELDFNVPISGSEQMYLALKTLGVETQLVIYPGEFHGISKPSYERDVSARFRAWFDRYLKP